MRVCVCVCVRVCVTLSHFCVCVIPHWLLTEMLGFVSGHVRACFLAAADAPMRCRTERNGLRCECVLPPTQLMLCV
jgi:hypothetical protein